ncbi:ABC transporter permease [Sedimenticola sp.]|uniref:ABC transporter permease n=1 Tax=Sedimenticola sp. TaxID=1940285 RepID=UPI002588A965|nr:FtsX-like permease family protein [Sedimenticola sp.]MCW8903103.1 FtsX-like permease family protein [Sedimenticola sp.]
MKHSDQLHADASRLPMLLFIAWRNLWRSPVRSILTISALAGGLVMVILYAAMMEGMIRQMVHQATAISIGHLQIHRQAYVDDQDLYATLPWSYLDRIAGEFPEISLAPRLYASGLASTAETSTGVLIKAVDPEREPQVTRMLQQVRQGKMDLGPADNSKDGLPRNNLVIGAQLAKNMKLQPGSELVLVTQAADGSIGNALYRVAAILKPLEPNFDRMGVLMSIAAYQQLMYLTDGFHELVIRLDDATDLGVMQAELDTELKKLVSEQPLDELGGAPVVRNWRQLTPMVADMLEISKTITFFVGFIVIALASLGMLNTMLMAVHERTHEFGILLAIGMKRRWLLLMVLLESFFLGLVSALTGALLGIGVIQLFGERGIDFSGMLPDGYDWGGIVFEPYMKLHLEPLDLLLACLLMLIVTLLASLLPAWRTVRLRPAEVMR